MIGQRERFSPEQRESLETGLRNCKCKDKWTTFKNYYRWQGIRTGIDLVESLLDNPYRTPQEAIQEAREVMLGDWYRRLVGIGENGEQTRITHHKRRVRRKAVMQSGGGVTSRR